MFHGKKSSECGIERPLERLNYHFGQMMTERDFRDQQRYYNEKRWMLNRYTVGWGVIHGLKVQIKNSSENCEGKPQSVSTNGASEANINMPQNSVEISPPCVEVSPGFALDQYGNEILVSMNHGLNVAELLKRISPCSQLKERDGTNPKLVYIAIRYRECGTEPFRLPETHCCDNEADCTYSRTRETYEFLVSRTSWKAPDEAEIRDDFGCLINSFKNLRNPKATIIESHPQRTPCQPVPLASLSYIKGKWVVDNFSERCVTYSNYHLGGLVHCLISELWKVHAVGEDRRSSVPLLAQTIPGLNYRNGKTMLMKETVGEVPFRITTDGTFVWYTDFGLNKVHRIRIDDGSYTHFDLPTESHGHGIAFDGHFMWVTMPENNSLEKINICTLKTETFSELTDMTNPEEIVFDGKNLWITTQHFDEYKTDESGRKKKTESLKPASETLKKEYRHSPFQFTRFDPFNNTTVSINIPSDENGIYSSIIGMIFDGTSIWFAYNDNRNRSICRRIRIEDIDFDENGNPNNSESVFDDPIELRGDNAADITFDGNAVWVVHDEGASKIDVMEYREIAATNDRGLLSSIVFDGKVMWTVLNQDNESELRQCDLHTLENKSGYELRIPESTIKIGRMCFDGSYLWVTGSKTSGETGKGFIYRILP